jgi:PTH1 family peptidyl-tRNA hydrolase
MNRSGEAVLAVARKYKIAPENIIVVADDLYIDKGNIRITMGGSSGGHNGIRSINERLGTPEYIKIKIGIKPDRQVNNTADYVLSKIDETSQELIDGAIEKARDVVTAIVSGASLAQVQGIYNLKNVSDD